ncbi:MAG TPA: DUF2339 domain-containing protein [Stellaceae bacterium]|nr:DUF2339 domain-containing protein [Stellaceae bacterium]
MLALIGALLVLCIAATAWRAGERRARETDARLSEFSARLAFIEARVRPPSGPPEPEAVKPPAPAAPPPAPAPAPPPDIQLSLPSGAGAGAIIARLEERLMRRWIAWLGALALALGIVFLVKYTIERGLFGPAARVASGIVLGLALLAAGEWTRRHKPVLAAGLPLEPDYIPPGLSAAGIVGLFASVYAGHALYALIPAAVAFALLAGVAAAAALLSLVHGQLMALLGFVGGYVAPALIETPNPSAAGLLLYVFLVTAGALVLLRWQRWNGLGWAVTAGVTIWAWLALLMPRSELPLGLYLIAVPALFVLTLPKDADEGRPSFVWAAAIADAMTMVVLVIAVGYHAQAIALASALTVLLAALGLRDPGFDRLAWIGGIMQLTLLAA